MVFPNPDKAAVHLTDWSEKLPGLTACLDRLTGDCFIRDALVVVDYPNWVHAAAYLRDKYGFSFVTDYMDDFTGFINPSEHLVRRNCLTLLSESSAVIASSQFLHDIAARYNGRVTIVRNARNMNTFILRIRPAGEKESAGHRLLRSHLRLVRREEGLPLRRPFPGL